MSRLAIVNARIVDPASGRDSPGSLVVDDRSIAALDVPPPDGAEVIDARGAVLAPGLIDAMAFRTDKAASLAGGITRLLLMPDQSPPLDDPALVERAERLGKPDVWVHPLAAATVGLGGTEIAEIGLMKAAGAAGVSTGRRAIADTGVMHRLLQYATGFELPVVTHCEDYDLTKGAVATEGEYATRWGLAAAPAFAESLAVARDIRLTEATGAQLHIAQVTTAESVALVRAAKSRGVAVTCGVTPPHMLLNESAVGGYRTFARLSPPLRAEDDRKAVLDGLADGTIDVIASGHDPRAQDAKRLPFADAEPGAAGAATLLALALTLVRDGRLSLAELLARLTTAPARIFGLPEPTLTVGAAADLVLFDPEAPWRIDSDRLPGRAGNTPFDGLPVQGRVLMTIKGGDAVRV